uniref:Uncharacterized protein n=1 Tax=Cacopsylla melanoneura TaxID=428564 RepID=A0A8D9ABH7_9HEMI
MVTHPNAQVVLPQVALVVESLREGSWFLAGVGGGRPLCPRPPLAHSPVHYVGVHVVVLGPDVVVVDVVPPVVRDSVPPRVQPRGISIRGPILFIRLLPVPLGQRYCSVPCRRWVAGMSLVLAFKHLNHSEEVGLVQPVKIFDREVPQTFAFGPFKSGVIVRRLLHELVRSESSHILYQKRVILLNQTVPNVPIVHIVQRPMERLYNANVVPHARCGFGRARLPCG